MYRIGRRESPRPGIEAAMAAWLDSPDAWTRRNGADYFTRVRSSSAQVHERLVALARDADLDVRKYALDAISRHERIDAPGLQAAIGESFNHPNDEVRRNARRAAGKHGSSTVPSLEELQRTNDSELHSLLDTLAKLPSLEKPMLVELARILTRSGHHQHSAVSVFLKQTTLPPEVKEILVAGIASSDSQTVWAAARVFSERKEIDAAVVAAMEARVYLPGVDANISTWLTMILADAAKTDASLGERAARHMTAGDERVRLAAIRILAWCEPYLKGSPALGPRVAASAVDLAKSGTLTAWERNAALWALSEVIARAPELAKDVAVLLDDPAGEVATGAARILILSGPPITAAERATAKKRLVDIAGQAGDGNHDSGPFLAAWQLGQPGIRETLDEADKDVMLAMLKSDDRTRHHVAMSYFEAVKASDPKTIAALGEKLETLVTSGKDHAAEIERIRTLHVRILAEASARASCATLLEQVAPMH